MGRKLVIEAVLVVLGAVIAGWSSDQRAPVELQLTRDDWPPSRVRRGE